MRRSWRVILDPLWLAERDQRVHSPAARASPPSHWRKKPASGFVEAGFVLRSCPAPGFSARPSFLRREADAKLASLRRPRALCASNPGRTRAPSRSRGASRFPMQAALGARASVSIRPSLYRRSASCRLLARVH
jgi:hypothetical protein